MRRSSSTSACRSSSGSSGWKRRTVSCLRRCRLKSGRYGRGFVEVTSDQALPSRMTYQDRTGMAAVVFSEIPLTIDRDEVLRFQGYKKGRDVPTPEVEH